VIRLPSDGSLFLTAKIHCATTKTNHVSAGRSFCRHQDTERNAHPAAQSLPCFPFCGDKYPPLKGAPGTVVCTKPRYLATDMHLNEETGWAWPDDSQ